MRAGAKRKRWQESGLTQLTDLVQAAFDIREAQRGEHSVAAAVSTARRAEYSLQLTTERRRWTTACIAMPQREHYGGD